MFKMDEDTASRDIFKRCFEYTRPDEFQAMGLYPYFTPFEAVEGDNSPVVKLHGRDVLMFGSNNYLGLTTHPRVKEAARKAIDRYGSGCSGSRMLNGTLDIHLELEEELADFTGKEAALLYSTGFMTNGCLSTLVGRDEYAILDKSVHASIVYGTMAAHSKSYKRFKHNDVEDLESILSALDPEKGKLVVVDGVFSMEGDLAPVPELAELCSRYGARLYVDEAHGVGVLGPKGIGAAEHLGAQDAVDVYMATFSKSFASTGGFIAAEKPVISYLKHHSPPFIYSASMPAPSVAAARASLEIIRSEPERRAHLLEVSARARAGLKAAGFEVYDGITPVIPVIINDELVLCQFFKALLDAGIYTNPIFKPAAEKCMIRISCMAIHENPHIDRLVETMTEVGRHFQLLG